MLCQYIRELMTSLGNIPSSILGGLIAAYVTHYFSNRRILIQQIKDKIDLRLQCLHDLKSLIADIRYYEKLSVFFSFTKMDILANKQDDEKELYSVEKFISSNKKELDDAIGLCSNFIKKNRGILFEYNDQELNNLLSKIIKKHNLDKIKMDIFNIPNGLKKKLGTSISPDINKLEFLIDRNIEKLLKLKQSTNNGLVLKVKEMAINSYHAIVSPSKR